MVEIGSLVSEKIFFFKFHPPFFLICIIGKSSKFIKNPVIYVKTLIIMLIRSNLSIFWLKIEQFWQFEKNSFFSNGGHLGYRRTLTDTILKGDHPRIISAKFG